MMHILQAIFVQNMANFLDDYTHLYKWYNIAKSWGNLHKNP